MTTDTTTHAIGAAPTRALDGHAVPSVGTWDVDPGHTSVEFVGRHFMLTKVRGRFTDVTGVVTIGRDPADSALEVEIRTASVSSGSDARDGHLRSSDLFDVERFPTATFRSTHVDWRGGRADVTGDLTIVGVTRPVVLAVEFLGATVDLDGNARAVFSAHADIDREDWGITWNQALETGGVLVSKKIRLEIETEVVRRG